jgi:UPF0042 nucleotide-binding protein
MVISSFAYKTRVSPPDAVEFDCRILANPHSVPSLRPLSGLDAKVQAYVAEDSKCLDLQRAAYTLAKQGAPHIAFGCYGGRHRSVAMAELLARSLQAVGVCVSVEHLCL